MKELCLLFPKPTEVPFPQRCTIFWISYFLIKLEAIIQNVYIIPKYFLDSLKIFLLAQYNFECYFSSSKWLFPACFTNPFWNFSQLIYLMHWFLQAPYSWFFRKMLLKKCSTSELGRGSREIGEIGSRIRTDQDNFKLSSL